MTVQGTEEIKKIRRMNVTCHPNISIMFCLNVMHLYCFNLNLMVLLCGQVALHTLYIFQKPIFSCYTRLGPHNLYELHTD